MVRFETPPASRCRRTSSPCGAGAISKAPCPDDAATTGQIKDFNAKIRGDSGLLLQALQEHPEQAQPYAQFHSLLEAPPPCYTVQMWTRLGYAPVGPAPRRGVDAQVLKA